MALIEKLTHEELAVYEILRNPVLSAEFINNYDKQEWEETFLLTYYQREMVSDFNQYVNFCTARSTGKTVSLVALITWALVFNLYSSEKDNYLLFVVPSRVHLQPVWEGLLRGFRSNSFLKNFVARNSGINSSDYSVKLLNNASLICRIVGQTGTGSNLVGLHTPMILADELGYFNWVAWQEMQPDLNIFVPGCRLVGGGVPTGLRENNVLYHCDQVNSNYTKHRVSAFENPRLTEEDHVRAEEQYGGKDNPDYIHYHLGQHGTPVFALFDRNLLQIEQYPVYQLLLNGIEIGPNINEYITKLSLFPSVGDKKVKTLIGIDLGYTEPTAIIIFTLDNYQRFRFHGRIRLEKVSYPIQEKIIDYLDGKYDPVLIGIDKGSSGMSVVQHLQEGMEYVQKNYEKRLIPIDFSSWTVIGIDADGQEIKTKTKPFSVSILQDYSNNHKIIYSSTDLEMVTELERMTYTKNPNGDIAYRTLTLKGGKKGEDHFTSAMLCASMAYYVQNEFIQQKAQKKQLYRPSWF